MPGAGAQGTPGAAPRRKRRPNLARLNHILVPRRSDQRDRFRKGAASLITMPIWWAHGALSREGRAAVGLTALVAAAGLDVGRSQVYLLCAALSGLLVASIALRPLYSMRGATLRVHAPRRVTAREDVTFSVDVAAQRTLSAVRVDTPFLPWDGRWTGAARGIARIEAGKTATTTATARFVERGEHHLDPFHARALVPIGLAAGAAVASDTCRFLVLPQVARVESLASAPGTRGERRQASTHLPAMEGDLAGVRPYRPGDPIRQLHARTWARVGEPHVREHVREVSERGALVLIADRSSDEALVEAAISLAAGVAAVMVRSESGLGMVALGAAVVVARPGCGAPRAVLDDVLDRLATWRAPDLLAADLVIGAIEDHTSGVSTVVVVTCDRDRAPGEVPDHAAATVEALRAAGLRVRVVLVVEEEGITSSEGGPTRIGRGVIERLEPIRL